MANNAEQKNRKLQRPALIYFKKGLGKLWQATTLLFYSAVQTCFGFAF